MSRSNHRLGDAQATSRHWVELSWRKVKGHSLIGGLGKQGQIPIRQSSHFKSTSITPTTPAFPSSLQPHSNSKMASVIAAPFRRSYRYIVRGSLDSILFWKYSWTITIQQRQAHENPVILWSVGIGCLGPVLLVAVPPIRKSLGWKPAERLPSTYPGESCNSLTCRPGPF